MSEVRIDSLSNESNTGGPTLSGITTFSGTNYFVPPVGSTQERPENPEKGSLRFNTDSGGLEYYKGDGLGWVSVEASEVYYDVNSGNRGIIGGAWIALDTIEYLELGFLGNSIDFGNLSVGRHSQAQACANGTRLIFGGGYSAGGHQNVLDYVAVHSKGNAVDFGDSTIKRNTCGAVGNQTRGIWGSGDGIGGAKNNIDYVTIATTGNAADFGDCLTMSSANGASSSVRGYWHFGHPSSPRRIEYVNHSTTGNSITFGDAGPANPPASYNRRSAAASDATRAIFAGGYQDNIILYLTMSTQGTLNDFGDLTNQRYQTKGMSTSTRGVFAGARQFNPSPSLTYYPINTIDYITFSTRGNAADFGDLVYMNPSHPSWGSGVQAIQAQSNGHGGLSG